MHTFQYPMVREIGSAVLIDPRTGRTIIARAIVAKTVKGTGGSRKV